MKLVNKTTGEEAEATVAWTAVDQYEGKQDQETFPLEEALEYAEQKASAGYAVVVYDSTDHVTFDEVYSLNGIDPETQED
jgi:hypothetical protein